MNSDKPRRKILLARSDLRELGVPWTNAHLLKLEATGRFPKRIYLSSAKVAWAADEIEAFIEERAATGRTAPNSADV